MKAFLVFFATAVLFFSKWLAANLGLAAAGFVGFFFLAPLLPDSISAVDRGFLGVGIAIAILAICCIINDRRGRKNVGR